MCKCKKIIKILIASLIIVSANTFNAEARTVVDSVDSNGIKIELSNDGHYNITSTLTGGKILYFTRSGETTDTLKGDIFSSDVFFFDKNGKLLSESKSIQGQPRCNFEDYGNWYAWGYTIDVSDDSDFAQMEGYKVMQGNKKLDDFEGWLACNLTDSNYSYFEVNAVYSYDNGSYSQPVTKLFTLSKEDIEESLLPTLTVTEKEKGSGYIRYTLNCEKSVNGDDLSHVTVLKPNGETDVLQIGDVSTLDYDVYKAGVYTFTLNTATGKSATVLLTVPSLDYSLGQDAISNSEEVKKPEVTFTGIPDKAKLGDTVTVHAHSSVPCIINYNGSSYSDQDIDIPITENGDYSLELVDSNGAVYKYPFRVNCFIDDSTDGSLEAKDTNYWSAGKSSDNYDAKKLPQTGGIFYNGTFSSGVLFTSAGLIFIVLYIIKRRRVKDNG